MSDTGSGPSGLLASLRRLDTLLSLAAAQVPAVHGADAATDRFRGLYVGADQVARLLDRQPGAPLFATLADRWGGAAGDRYPADDPDEAAAGAGTTDAAAASGSGPTRLSWLATTCGLDPFALDVLVLALAPEIDSRYDRIYGYLQDDVTRRRPTIDLALSLLCHDAAERLLRRWHFSPDGPLVRERLIELVPDASQSAPSLLVTALRVDEQVVNLLLEQEVLDSRLAKFCRFEAPLAPAAPLAVAPELVRALSRRVRAARERREPLRLELVGPEGAGQDDLVRTLASAARCEVLRADAAGMLAHSRDPADTLELVARQAWFRDAILHLTNAAALSDPERERLAGSLREALERFPGLAVIASVRQLPPGSLPTGTLHFHLAAPAPAVRRRLWRAALDGAVDAVPPDVLDALSDRFRLTAAQIEGAAHAAQAQASLRAAEDDGPARPSRRELFAAAAEQTGSALERLATRSRPTTPWSALVLPPDATAQLRELCDRAIHGRTVMDEWGFGPRLARGRGVNALFSGPSGTGKTMAAEIVAAELGVDLWRIELAGVVSKYIGETEKNLDRIFQAASTANGILFFDEAEALFGKRSEVRDSHDRYANLEIAYLLQKMEQFDGVAILATNLRGNLDEAFVRRLAFSVHFPFPDEASRLRIWAGIFPSRTPLADDVDLDRLARVVRLSGGHIRNIALAASFLAAADGGRVSMRHLVEASRREYQKLGKEMDPVSLAAGA